MRWLALLAMGALLAGCGATVELKNALPPVPLPPQCKVEPPFQSNPPSSDAAAWWQEFNEPVLSALVTEALARNADIEAARARVQASRALLDAGRSTAYPRLDASAGFSRSRASLEDPARNPAAPRTGSRWTADAALSWEVDLFGQLDAENRALAWRARASEDRAHAVRLAVTTDVVSRFLELAALDERLRLIAEALADDQVLLALTQAKARGGQASQQDVMRAQAQLSRDRAVLAQLRSNRADTFAALAVLMASTPDDVAGRMTALKLPAGVSDALTLAAPSELLMTRPDVRAAIAELRATSADLAATAAQRFPRFDIGATLGWVTASASGLGTANALAAAVLPGLRWRALDFGELDARLAGRKAAEIAAAADYKASVTRAFAEAQTALLQLQDRRDRVAAAQEVLQSQQVVCEVQRAKHAAGLSDLAAALDACREENSAADALVQAHREALAGRVQLHKALGAGTARAGSTAG